MKSKFDCTSTILSNKKIAKDHLKLTLSCPPIALRVHPGQFVMVRIDSRFDPLLRRPFSVYRTKSDQFVIVYQVVGRGTEILSAKSPGEELQVLGPIGNGFTILSFHRNTDLAMETKPRETSFATPKAILVAGGVGIASLMLLAVELRKREIDVIALIGATNRDRLIGVDDLTEIGAKVMVSTEDGSVGHHGLVTELLEKELRVTNYELRMDKRGKGTKGQRGKERKRENEKTSPEGKESEASAMRENNSVFFLCNSVANNSEIRNPSEGKRAKRALAEIETITNHQSPITNLFVYACGPYGMLKSVAKIVLVNDIPVQLSFESRMACGLGACLGCAIKVKTPDGGFEYKRVCRDGPVFDAKEVRW